MSHQPERKEKNCLNCGATVHGRFCHVCGQENIVPKQSFWGLSKHFVYDIFHFDGKFFETLGHLFLKPGSISQEYVGGKRVKYLDPIRMYLFTSAIFFLVFFSVRHSEEVVHPDENRVLSKAERLELLMEVNGRERQAPTDTLLKSQEQVLLDSTLIVVLAPMNDTSHFHSVIESQGKPYHLIAQQEREINPFKGEGKGWLGKMLETKWAKFRARYSDNMNEGLTEMMNGFLHKLPYLLFLSLPFFAGILKLLYRRRKEYYFSDHAVFTLHHYIISFILMLLFLVFDTLQKTTGWVLFGFLSGLMFVLWPLYLLVGMKRFYQQRWRSTLGKFLLVNMLGVFVLLFLMVLFVLFSIIQL